VGFAISEPFNSAGVLQSRDNHEGVVSVDDEDFVKASLVSFGIGEPHSGQMPVTLAVRS
jgi:hypothetical protein